MAFEKIIEAQLCDGDEKPIGSFLVEQDSANKRALEGANKKGPFYGQIIVKDKDGHKAATIKITESGVTLSDYHHSDVPITVNHGTPRLTFSGDIYTRAAVLGTAIATLPADSDHKEAVTTFFNLVPELDIAMKGRRIDRDLADGKREFGRN